MLKEKELVPPPSTQVNSSPQAEAQPSLAPWQGVTYYYARPDLHPAHAGPIVFTTENPFTVESHRLLFLPSSSSDQPDKIAVIIGHPYFRLPVEAELSFLGQNPTASDIEKALICLTQADSRPHPPPGAVLLLERSPLQEDINWSLIQRGNLSNLALKTTPRSLSQEPFPSPPASRDILMILSPPPAETISLQGENSFSLNIST